MDVVALAAIVFGVALAWQKVVVLPYRATDDVVKSVFEARRATKGGSSIDPTPFIEIALVVLAAKGVSVRRKATVKVV